MRPPVSVALVYGRAVAAFWRHVYGAGAGFLGGYGAAGAAGAVRGGAFAARRQCKAPYKAYQAATREAEKRLETACYDSLNEWLLFSWHDAGTRAPDHRRRLQIGSIRGMRVLRNPPLHWVVGSNSRKYWQNFSNLQQVVCSLRSFDKFCEIAIHFHQHRQEKQRS